MHNTISLLNTNGITMTFFVPITTRQKFRLVQIETSCRRHFKVHLKKKINATLGRKYREKRRNCLLQATSPSFKMFSTTTLPLVHQNVALCSNGINYDLDI